MRKILIFEDEWNSIKGSFELANIISFSNELEFDVKTKSQDVNIDIFLQDIYSAIFIDHTLSKKTNLDGMNIYAEIQRKKVFDMSKVFILTGNNNFKSYCQERGFQIPDNAIIFKPANFTEIEEKLKIIFK